MSGRDSLGAMGIFKALCLASTMMIAFCGTAAAQSVDDEGAKAHFQAGANYYQTGSYADALREFQAAYTLSPRPELFINVSLCYQQLGDFDSAIAYLNKYLEAKPTATNRVEIEMRVAELKKRKEQQAAVTLPAPDAQSRTVQDHSQQGANDTTTQTAHVIAAPAESDADDGGGIPTASLVSFIAGGVGVVVFATFGLMAMGEDSSLADGCGKDKSCTDDDVSTLKTDALLADIGLGVAVVGAGLGVLFWVLDDSGEKAPESNGVAVTPVLSPSTAGLALSGRF